MINLLKKAVFYVAFRTVRFCHRKLSFRDCIYVVAPTGAGSLGDQALIQGLKDGLVSIGEEAELVEVIPQFGQQPQFLKTGQLRTRHFSSGSRFAKIKFAFMALEAKSLLILGADTLDGGYDVAKNMAWFDLADLLAFMEIPTAFVSFSFSETPSDKVVARLKTINPFVRFFSRDPISAKRFEQLSGIHCELSADLAFLVNPERFNSVVVASADWTEEQRKKGNIVMGLNVNPLHMDGVREVLVMSFINSLTYLCNLNDRLVILLVPHDFREGQSDEIILSEIKAALPPLIAHRVRLACGPFDAWDAKFLIGKVDFLVTGRMHLGIAALGSGVPVYGLAYKDKFEGLMRHFALTDNLLPREEALDTERLSKFLSDALSRHYVDRKGIKEIVEEVKTKSRKNLYFLKDNRR